jgi:hypothetical protein
MRPADNGAGGKVSPVNKFVEFFTDAFAKAPAHQHVSFDEHTSSPAEREARLQRLGDASLFVAGFFAHGLERRLVDMDYHIKMGGRAYGTLAAAPSIGPRRTPCGVFGELARKFRGVVEAIGEIGEIGEIGDAARVCTPSDVLRRYELWLRAGSHRAQALLRRLGVAPVQASLLVN